ncbi:MAG: amidohydrolase family protein [Burkholderiales bacterium]|nr:amidohydrolase family protein [Burkholderiales bacterium]
MGAIAAKCAGLLAALALASHAVAQRTDTLLLNGRFVTLDPATPRAEALAVRDGRIVALGRSAQLRRLAGAGTRVIDLRGRTVIPGLIDSHIHAIRAGLTYSVLGLR